MSLFLEMLYKRRSIRSFADRPVERQTVDMLIEAALLSPSSRSLRPWECIVVDEPKTLEELAASKENGSSFLGGAPLALVVLGLPDISDVWIEDCSLVSLLVQLQAEALGLKSCWIQIRGRKHSDTVSSEDYIKALLDIPSERRVESIVAVGYPEESKSPYTREDLPFDKIHFNRY
jgi:nitroreductase